MNSELFKRYKLVNGFRVITGCAYCEGAVFRDWTECEDSVPSNPILFKCFHCGRLFQVSDGALKLWPHREYDHLSRTRVLRLAWVPPASEETVSRREPGNTPHRCSSRLPGNGRRHSQLRLAHTQQTRK